jgi:hypothetical protein
MKGVMNVNFKQIAKMLDLEIGEDFRVGNANNSFLDGVFQFQNSGLMHDNEYACEPLIIGALLYGTLKIDKLPWEPKFNQVYYVPDITQPDKEDKCHMEEWRDEPYDEYNFKNKLICKTQDEAIKKSDIILKLWNEYCNSDKK